MSTPVQGYDSTGKAYRDIAVDGNGNQLMSTAASAAGGSSASPLYVASSAAATRTILVPSGAVTASGQSGNLAVGGFRELLVLVNITLVSGTTPSETIAIDTNDAGGTGAWYTLLTSAAQTAAGVLALAVGAGLANGAAAAGMPFGDTIRVRWTVSGTTPSFTQSVTVIGK